jgi:hypothetical protein
MIEKNLIHAQIMFKSANLYEITVETFFALMSRQGTNDSMSIFTKKLLEVIFLINLLTLAFYLHTHSKINIWS